MKILRCISLIISVLLLPWCLASCLAGAEDSSSLAGERDDVHYSYIEDVSLLVLNSDDPIAQDNRIFELPFVNEVKAVYISGEVTEVAPACFDRFEKLEKIGTNDAQIMNTLLQRFDERKVKIECVSPDDFEKTLTNAGIPIGHCPEKTKGRCLICGLSCSYDFDGIYSRFLRYGSEVYDETVILEGKELYFDKDGHLEAEGFLRLGGEKRLYEDDRIVSGTRDIDGVRYTFASNGLLTSEKELDTEVPLSYVLFPFVALPLGIVVCIFVYKLYKRKEKSEEEEG